MLMKIGLVLVVIVIALTLFKKVSRTPAEPKKEEVSDQPVEMKQDSICGTFVEETTKFKVKYYDKIYYFCSEECKQKFIDQKQAENTQN